MTCTSPQVSVDDLQALMDAVGIHPQRGARFEQVKAILVAEISSHHASSMNRTM